MDIKSCAPSVEVPASKSILCRALLLSAFSSDTVRLQIGALCEDTRAFIGCLRALGVAISEQSGTLIVRGCNGNFVRGVMLDVKNSAATARFLAAAIAFCGGDAVFTASESMSKRPMSFLKLLEGAGARIEPLQQNSLFPFRMRSDGIHEKVFQVDTAESTQYASGILMAASANAPACVKLEGPRTESGYLNITLSLMRAFNVDFIKHENTITILSRKAAPAQLKIEADLSSACYFGALAMLARTKILIRNATTCSLQPDLKFLLLLKERGLVLTETEQGLLADGTRVESFEGFDEDFSGFSDQALTAAALAPFATTPTRIRNVAHIRRQECDRMQAIFENLTALGVPVKMNENEIEIEPAPVRATEIKTFSDHRVAMAFALVGARCPVVIDDPSCCSKTFERYFQELNGLNLFDKVF